MTFTLVLPADARFDKTVFDQAAQNPVQGLFRHTKQGQQGVDGLPRLAVDEMDRPVMGAAISVVFQNPVGVGGKGAIGEEHRLDTAAQLFVG